MERRRHAGYVLCALAAAALSACASHEYLYAPAVSSSAVISGYPASYYQIPPEAPRGDVRIATFGFAEVKPEGASGGEGKRALHVRMVVANNSDTPWRLDTREQRIELPGAPNLGESRPAYAMVEHGTPPEVQIPPGQSRTVDLFYPLPESMQKAEKLPAFDTIWKVETNAGPTVMRTPFERIDVTPIYDPYYDYAWGYGSPFWWDPGYPAAGSFVGVAVGPAYVHRPVVIRRYRPY